MTESQWDETSKTVKRTHVNHKELNLLIQKQYSKLLTSSVEYYLTHGEDFHIKDFKDALNGPKLEQVSFYYYWQKEIQRMKMENCFGNAAVV